MAKVSLSQQGLAIDTTSYVYSETGEGEILAQDPPAGTSMSRKEGLDILVSLGDESTKFFMPDFRGTELGGEDPLAGLPLNIGKIKEVPFAGEEGVILAQSPLPGSRVDAEASIEFTVSVFYQEERPSPLTIRWITSSVTVPLSLGGKEVRLEIKDVRGTREVSYGHRDPGEKVWFASPVTGAGQIRVYVGEELVLVENVRDQDWDEPGFSPRISK